MKKKRYYRGPISAHGRFRLSQAAHRRCMLKRYPKDIHFNAERFNYHLAVLNKQEEQQRILSMEERVAIAKDTISSVKDAKSKLPGFKDRYKFYWKS